jgi:hypothetical protein
VVVTRAGTRPRTRPRTERPRGSNQARAPAQGTPSHLPVSLYAPRRRRRRRRRRCGLRGSPGSGWRRACRRRGRRCGGGPGPGAARWPRPRRTRRPPPPSARPPPRALPPHAASALCDGTYAPPGRPPGRLLASAPRRRPGPEDNRIPERKGARESMEPAPRRPGGRTWREPNASAVAARTRQQSLLERVSSRCSNASAAADAPRRPRGCRALDPAQAASDSLSNGSHA